MSKRRLIMIVPLFLVCIGLPALCLWGPWIPSTDEEIREVLDSYMEAANEYADNNAETDLDDIEAQIVEYRNGQLFIGLVFYDLVIEKLPNGKTLFEGTLENFSDQELCEIDAEVWLYAKGNVVSDVVPFPMEHECIPPHYSVDLRMTYDPSGRVPILLRETLIFPFTGEFVHSGPITSSTDERTFLFRLGKLLPGYGYEAIWTDPNETWVDHGVSIDCYECD